MERDENKITSRVHAKFTHSSSNTSDQSSPSSLYIMSQTSPIITSALSYSYPILLIIDNILSFITWTSEDPYYNFLCVSGIVLVVLKWQLVINYFLPLMFAFVFSCFAWSIQAIVKESSPDTAQESRDEVPTIKEILDTLDNISTRFGILVEPLSALKALNKSDVIRISLCTVWLTPLQVFLIKYVVSLQKVIVSVTIISLIFYSPWFIATRKLLWRSLYIRKLVFVLTGLKFNTRNEPFDQKSFKILSDNKISSSRNGKIIEFEILENQRRWIAIGWCDYLLPYERPNYTTVLLSECQSPDNFEFTTIHSSHSWRWLENSWSIDFEFNKNKDGDGWVYYDSNWKYPSYYDGVTKYTRTRKWKRKAILIVDKPSE